MAPLAVELIWLPLGAGGSCVRWSGRAYEVLTATLARRQAVPIFHAALRIGTHVIEVGPIRDGDGAGRGVTVEGPVGTRLAGRLRLFLYEVRCWPDGVIDDLRFAAAMSVLDATESQARRVLELTAEVPVLTWGRDERGTGDMWNSNSVVSWLLARAGIRTAGIRPPLPGRAPGWHAGLQLACDAAAA